MRNIFEQIFVYTICTLSITLGFVVWNSSRRTKLNIWFLILTISITCWVLFAFLGFYELSGKTSAIFYKLNWASVSLFLLSSYFFYVEAFLHIIRPLLRKIILLVSMLFIIVSLFSNLIIREVVIQDWGAEIKFGMINDLFNIFAVLVSIVIVYYFIRNYLRLSQREKTKIFYFFIGTALIIILNIIFNILSPIFTQTTKYQHFGDYSAVFLLGFTAYAIIKQELFNIKIVLTAIFIIFIGLLLAFDLFIFTDVYAIKIVGFIMYIYFGYMLIKSSYNEIERREELLEKNNELKILQKSATDLVKTLDSNEIYKRAVNNIPYELGYLSAILIIKDKSDNLLKIEAASENFLVNQVKKLINKDFRDFPVDPNLSDNKNLPCVKALKDRVPYFTDDYIEAFSPILDNLTISAIKKIINAKSIATFPLDLANDNEGVISFFIKDKSSSELLMEDQNLMKTFVSEISIALQNANLLEETKKYSERLTEKNEQLEAKNKELDTIFRITNQIVTTLNPQEVAQRAVDSIPNELGYIGASIISMNDKREMVEVLAITDYPVREIFTKVMQSTNAAMKIGSKTKPISVPFDDKNFMIGNDLYEALGSLIPKEYTDQIQQEIGINTIVNTPIITRNKIVAVMSFYLKQTSDEQITKGDYDLMQTFAFQVGIGLENARLFKQYEALSNELVFKNKQLEEYSQKEKDILDIMGHELRTPITIVRNTLSLLEVIAKKEVIDHEKLNHYLDVALRSAKREINIIETMLAATKIEADKIEIFRSQVDTKDVIDEAVTGQKQNALQKGLQLNVNVQEDIPDIFMDRSRGQEIIDNFLSNAVKYTQSGSVTIDVKEEGDFVRFSVSDTGYGIPQEDLSHLGTKFFRIKQYVNVGTEEEKEKNRLYNVVRPGGTGLGLYVTFNLVKLHGGEVKVESEPGKGSTFSFTMPKYVGQKSEVDEKKSKNLLDEYKRRKAGEKVSDQ